MRHDHGAHGHANCVRSTLALAEAQCEERGAKLTPIRRRVLEVVAAAHGPVGAYDVVERLAAAGEGRPAPITVYRALDFLIGQQLVHRIASRNAYVACNHSHAAEDTIVFLICEACGDVEELADPRVARTIAAASAAEGFNVRQPVLELTGTCARCAPE
jgi:Fur family zinc uptake transcriptional regulator